MTFMTLLMRTTELNGLPRQFYQAGGSGDGTDLPNLQEK
jgi:hypothetical protein